MSKLKDPVDTDSMSIALLCPSFITEPFPKLSVICAIAASNALFFSLYPFACCAFVVLTTFRLLFSHF